MTFAQCSNCPEAQYSSMHLLLPCVMKCRWYDASPSFVGGTFLTKTQSKQGGTNFLPQKCCVRSKGYYLLKCTLHGCSSIHTCSGVSVWRAENKGAQITCSKCGILSFPLLPRWAVCRWAMLSIWAWEQHLLLTHPCCWILLQAQSLPESTAHHLFSDVSTLRVMFKIFFLLT